jgi:hypothetical protein
MTMEYRVARDAVNEPMLEVRELSLSFYFFFWKSETETLNQTVGSAGSG